jgi:hypothetical protein
MAGLSIKPSVFQLLPSHSFPQGRPAVSCLFLKLIHSAKQRLIHTLFNEFPYNLWAGEYIGSWCRKGIKSFSKRTPFTLECMSFILIEVVPKTAHDTFEWALRAK